MFATKYFKVKILIFSLLLKQTFSLECFTCSSQLDLPSTMTNRCDYVSYSYYGKSDLSHCPEPNLCAKYIVEHDGVKWVHRACQPRNICSLVAAKYNDNRNTLIECQTCSDDAACNLVGKVAPFSILLLLPVFLSNLIK